MQNNPGLRELLNKHNQEVINVKARVNNGIIHIESETYYVSDPKLRTFISVKYKL